MKIFFVRHTDAEDDLNESFGGICDDRLIDSGREYAKHVAKLLSPLGINAIFTSPYKRARETADIINQIITVDVIEIFNLRERNSYGVISGITKKVAEEKFSNIYQRILEMKKEGKKPSNSTETLPGGEIFLDLINRIKDSIDQVLFISKLSKYKNVVVVSHGGIAWALFNQILKKDIELDKGEIIVLEGDTIQEIKVNLEETKALKERLKR